MRAGLNSKGTAIIAAIVLIAAMVGAQTASFAENGQQPRPAATSDTASSSSSDLARVGENATNASSMGPAMVMDDDAPVWPSTFAGRVMTWLGKWHVAAVHFPIALFIVIGIVEAAARLFRRPDWAGSDRLLVALTALSTVVAAALGWLAMGLDLPKDDFVHATHRVLGTALAALALLVWWSKEQAYAKATAGTRGLYFALLVLATTAVLTNAFFGGAMVHGGLRHMLF